MCVANDGDEMQQYQSSHIVSAYMIFALVNRADGLRPLSYLISPMRSFPAPQLANKQTITNINVSQRPVYHPIYQMFPGN